MSTPTSPKAAVNVQHSLLLDSQTTQADAHTQYHRQTKITEQKRKFSSCLESSVLDYLHYHPSQLEDCVKTLHTLFSNVVLYAEDPKYRKVVDMEKSWVFEYDSSSHQFK
eukprot:gene5438-5671_t